MFKIAILCLLLLSLSACESAGIPVLPTLNPTRTPTPLSSVSLPTAAPIATPGPQRGGDLREAIARDAVSFHPYLTTDAASALFQSKVYAGGLVRRDPKTLEPIPNMAEAWTVSPDGKTYTFKLRRDMRWSDGQPITAQDFQWTFEQASKTANRYPYLDNLREIASYQANDDYTLQVTLKDATCVGLTVADAIVPLPKHTWEGLDWSDPAKNPEIEKPTVTSGPFRLSEWKKGDHATFVRNGSFFRGVPYIDSDTLQIVPDAGKRLQMLQSGAVDTAPVDISDYAAARQVSSLQEYDWDPVQVTWDYVGVNLRRPLLQDVQLRRALAQAMPRQAIADQVWAGLAKPLYSPYAPTSGVYNPAVPRYDYDIGAAQTALLQAGYKTDPKGSLLGKDGKPISLKIVFNDDNPQHAQIARMVEAELDKLGIAANTYGVDFAAMLDYIRKPPYDYDLYVLGWQSPTDPYFLYQLWGTNNTPDVNLGAYVNKELEKLYEQSNHAPCDAASRKQVFQDIQGVLTYELPYFFLTFHTDYMFLNRRVAPNPTSKLGIAYLPEQWYLRAK